MGVIPPLRVSNHFRWVLPPSSSSSTDDSVVGGGGGGGGSGAVGATGREEGEAADVKKLKRAKVVAGKSRGLGMRFVGL